MQLGKVNNSASLWVIPLLFKSSAVSLRSLTNSMTKTLLRKSLAGRRLALQNAFLTFWYVRFFQNPPSYKVPTQPLRENLSQSTNTTSSTHTLSFPLKSYRNSSPWRSVAETTAWPFLKWPQHARIQDPECNRVPRGLDVVPFGLCWTRVMVAHTGLENSWRFGGGAWRVVGGTLGVDWIVLYPAETPPQTLTFINFTPQISSNLSA